MLFLYYAAAWITNLATNIFSSGLIKAFKDFSDDRSIIVIEKVIFSSVYFNHGNSVLLMGLLNFEMSIDSSYRIFVGVGLWLRRCRDDGYADCSYYHFISIVFFSDFVRSQSVCVNGRIRSRRSLVFFYYSQVQPRLIRQTVDSVPKPNFT